MAEEEKIKSNAQAILEADTEFAENHFSRFPIRPKKRWNQQQSLSSTQFCHHCGEPLSAQKDIPLKP